MRKKLIQLTIAALLTVIGSGCLGKPADPPVTAVTGTVMLDEAPVAGAQVIFFPMDPTLDESIPSITDRKGNFALARNLQTECILKPGRYRVLVAKYVRVQPDADGKDTGFENDPDYDEYRGKNVLPAIYNRKQKSPIEVVVGSGDSDFKIQLQSRP